MSGVLTEKTIMWYNMNYVLRFVTIASHSRLYFNCVRIRRTHLTKHNA